MTSAAEWAEMYSFSAPSSRAAAQAMRNSRPPIPRPRKGSDT